MDLPIPRCGSGAFPKHFKISARLLSNRAPYNNSQYSLLKRSNSSFLAGLRIHRSTGPYRYSGEAFRLASMDVVQLLARLSRTEGGIAAIHPSTVSSACRVWWGEPPRWDADLWLRPDGGGGGGGAGRFWKQGRRQRMQTRVARKELSKHSR